jgi:hypothetical protein
MSMNEGSDVSKGDKRDDVSMKSGVKARSRPDFTKYDGNGCGEKWYDLGLVRARAEMSEGGRLGVWESGKFVLWRQYSGKTFDELEDLVPFRELEKGDLYNFASVYWLVSKKMTGKLSKAEAWSADDLGMLFLMKRMQDANAGSIFTASMLRYYLNPEAGLRPYGHVITLTSNWVKRMRRKGLIEQLPGLKIWRGRKIAMFRVSADGRRVLKQFIEAFAEVHRDIRSWVKNTDDARYLRRYVARFTLGMSYNDVNTEDDMTFDEMVEITKRDLIEMGHKRLKSTDFWKDLPDGA